MTTSIIFDTNLFWDKYNLDSPILGTTLNFCFSEEDYQFVLPKIIKDEILNNYRKQLQKRYSRIKGDIAWYNKFTVRSENFLNEQKFEQDLISYREFLDSLIKSNQILELEYPNHSHQSIVERNIQKKKPFSDNDAGYKDTLIWLTILEHLKNTNNEVIFVSENKNDFEKKNEIHPDLLRELENLEINTDKF